MDEYTAKHAETSVNILGCYSLAILVGYWKLTIPTVYKLMMLFFVKKDLRKVFKSAVYSSGLRDVGKVKVHRRVKKKKMDELVENYLFFCT